MKVSTELQITFVHDFFHSLINMKLTNYFNYVVWHSCIFLGLSLVECETKNDSPTQEHLIDRVNKYGKWKVR